MPTTTDGQGLVFPSDASAGLDTRRLAANVSYEQELFTFQDAVEHVLDVFEIPRDARNTRMATRAVLKAHRVLPTLHTWPYYQRQCVVQTVAPYSTGTVSFDLTGGAYECLVTLASGTWPDWAGYGTLKLVNVNYPVLQRIDDTRITLDSRRHPLADLTAQAYTIFRARYPLPLDFRRRDRVFDPISLRELSAVGGGEANAMSVLLRGYGSPYQTTIVEDERHLGGLALQLNPSQNQASTFAFLYERSPRPLVTQKYATGTITTTLDSAAITGSGTAWTSAMIGSILRISADETEPQGVVGSIETTDLNPFAYQRVVMSVTSATALAVDQTIPEAASGRGYTLSDPVDVQFVSMLDVFLRFAEAEFARLTSREDVMKRQQWAQAQLDIARDAVRSSTSIQSANISDMEYGYGMIGSVSPTTLG